MDMRRLALVLLLIAPAAPAVAAVAPADFFETSIRPLLAENCFSCHSDARMSGLRLDSRAAVFRGGTRGPAVVPGDPQSSLLIQAVSHTLDKLKMPPTGRLSDSQIALLEKWVREGAHWPETGSPERSTGSEFWSFQPVQSPTRPIVRRHSWPGTDVDYFILSRLEGEGLEPAPPADKRTLIRRATFDLTGLPPTPGEAAAFLADNAPGAFEKVVERLLGSPHYGERWGRHWLDLARYADGVSGPFVDTPLTNAYRYRDWVIQAFNHDMPYDRFIKAQLAADLLPAAEKEENLPALGFHALRGKDDDRVDVTGRVFLGLTVGCAQCHDHKFDPIPTQDFYSLQAVFSNSKPWEYPLAGEDAVQAHKEGKQAVADKKRELDEFIEAQSDGLVDILISGTKDYLMAAWKVSNGADVQSAVRESGLDRETLERWIDYLSLTGREHRYLDAWDEANKQAADKAEAERLAAEFSDDLLAIHREKRAIEDRNYVKLGGREGSRSQKVLLATNLEFIDPLKWYLWRDICSEPFEKGGYPFKGGVLYYGSEDVNRFLGGAWRTHFTRLETELKTSEEAVPPPYPFIHGYREPEKIEEGRVAVRGDAKNLGELAPRRFLRVLSAEPRKEFENGSGRLALAEAIASADNPLTSRVMVNRIWQQHFGRGLVTTPSNFGQLGERPSHPELLDYLAARFVQSGWSIKAMHREIMLSAAYRLSSRNIETNNERDADNRLFWRANLRPRLDAESLRDTMLAVAGNLDTKLGGPPEPLTDDNARRAVYAKISRTRPDRTMTLFDFPDPKTSAPNRSTTLGPLHRLYFLNNSFVLQQARVLAERLQREAGANNEAKIVLAYKLLYSRSPEAAEITRALEFLGANDGDWPKYTQMLLASAEFTSVN